MRVIATIRTEFPTKFGIPRQSGIAQTRGVIRFMPEFRNPDAVRGLEGYSHVWLLWCFSESVRNEWSPTVRPPRLGGNRRMGVFATRSPFRPNPIGLSSVKLLSVVTEGKDAPYLLVEGADLMDGTPIYDIKPYLSFTDCHPDAVGGFADSVKGEELTVVFPEELKEALPPETLSALLSLLKDDPRPPYQKDASRTYGFPFSGYEIRFRVEGDTLTVTDVIREKAMK